MVELVLSKPGVAQTLLHLRIAALGSLTLRALQWRIRKCLRKLIFSQKERFREKQKPLVRKQTKIWRLNKEAKIRDRLSIPVTTRMTSG